MENLRETSLLPNLALNDFLPSIKDEETPNLLEVVFGPNLKEEDFGAIKDVFAFNKAERLIFFLRLFRPLSRVGGSPSESNKLDLDDALSTEVLLLLNEFCGTFEASLLARVSAESSF